jgi:hypothetical protein
MEPCRSVAEEGASLLAGPEGRTRVEPSFTVGDWRAGADASFHVRPRARSAVETLDAPSRVGPEALPNL